MYSVRLLRFCQCFDGTLARGVVNEAGRTATYRTGTNIDN